MTAIAGIASQDKNAEVSKILDKMTHRGSFDRYIMLLNGATLGMSWNKSCEAVCRVNIEQNLVADNSGPGHFARVSQKNGGLLLERDFLGVKPLYYGKTPEGELVFASEMKALTGFSTEIHLLPAGARLNQDRIWLDEPLSIQTPLNHTPEHIASTLLQRLNTAVQSRIKSSEMGSWLSGGLDSSAMAALARPHVEKLYTFAAGIKGAPDLEHARIMAQHLGSQHHEVVVTLDDMLKALPDVIFHLESFDSLLVRSSITNYLVSRVAKDYVGEVLSGEGGDELFGGYEYLKELNLGDLPEELIDITSRLHNTALQRVDRCSNAHGLAAHVPLLDPQVVEYALQIPVDLKIYDGTEKWIFRQAVRELLPESIANRTKAKFWEGAGVTNHLAEHARLMISDQEFSRQRRLPNGWLLNSKEELMYFQIFRQHFGDMTNLDWMGRTKGAPVEQY